MFFFFDDNKARSSSDVSPDRRDIITLSGFGIRNENLHNFASDYANLKVEYGANEYSPIKWNLNDTELQQWYDKRRSEKGNQRRKLKKNKLLLMELCFNLLDKYECQVFSFGLQLSDLMNYKYEYVKYFRYNFENLLQRLGMHLKYSLREDAIMSSITLDWPSSEIKPKEIAEIYWWGYYHGKGVGHGYKSGPLKETNLLPCLMFSRTIENPYMQIADLISGVCHDYVNWVHLEDGKYENRLCHSWPMIRKRIHRDRVTHPSKKYDESECGFVYYGKNKKLLEKVYSNLEAFSD